MENHIDTLAVLNGKLDSIFLENHLIGNRTRKSYRWAISDKKGMYLFISKGIPFRHLKIYALRKERQALPLK